MLLPVGFVKFLGLQMPEKVFCPAVSSYPWTPRSNLFLHWRFGALTTVVFLAMVAVWTIDGCNVKSFVEAWRFRREYLTHAHLNLTHNDENVTVTLSYIPVGNHSLDHPSDLDFQPPFFSFEILLFFFLLCTFSKRAPLFSRLMRPPICSSIFNKVGMFLFPIAG